MGTNPLIALTALGQSLWYDYITRDLIASGRLAALIADDGLRGMTSNPTIFEKAISGSEDYDADIRRLAALGRAPQEIFESLAVDDVRSACEAFAQVHRATGGADGLVSIEVNPELAHDTEGTISEARRLWAAVARPNAMIKIPATKAGIPAIEECLAEGISINITLLFAVERYEEVIEAFLRGLERRTAAGQPIEAVNSVASFFVSRVDGRVDPELDKKGDPQRLRGTIAIANAGMAYAAFERSRATPRWKALAAAGARPQRPLWASTSTKDPKYPDTHYVEALIAPETVNTIPPDTLEAYRDHGKPAVRIHEAMAGAPRRLRELSAQGIDLTEVTRFLENDGVAKFAASYKQLLTGIDAKAAALVK
ncbi:MAG TPA: transaldolase [Gemmatimonadales bacterium]